MMNCTGDANNCEHAHPMPGSPETPECEFDHQECSFAKPEDEGGLALSLVGIELRDYFAGQALAGLLAEGEYNDLPDAVASAYSTADAMMEARKGLAG